MPTQYIKRVELSCVHVDPKQNLQYVYLDDPFVFYTTPDNEGRQALLATIAWYKRSCNDDKLRSLGFTPRIKISIKGVWE